MEIKITKVTLVESDTMVKVSKTVRCPSCGRGLEIFIKPKENPNPTLRRCTFCGTVFSVEWEIIK